MDLLRNLFFAYVATVVSFTTPLVPTSIRAKVKTPLMNDMRNVSATASGSAEMSTIGGIMGAPADVVSTSIMPKPDVVIDDGAFIGKLPPVLPSITVTPTPCVDMFPQQGTNSNQLVPCVSPTVSTPSFTPTPTPPPGCYYEQMNCVQGGPIGSLPASCPAKLICKATGAPVPSEVPPGCYALQVCDEFPIGDMQPMAGLNTTLQNQSGSFVGPQCRTEVVCGKVTPTTVPSKTPTPVPSTPMPTSTLTPTPPTGCYYEQVACAQFVDPRTGVTAPCQAKLVCKVQPLPVTPVVTRQPVISLPVVSPVITKAAVATPTPPPGCYYEQMNCVQGGPVGSTSTNCPAKLICKAQPLPITSPLPAVTSTPTSTLTPTPPPGCKYVIEPGVCAQLIDPRTGVAAPCPQLTHLVCVPTIIPTKPACQPRPACLDATNGGVRCLLLEPKEGWCPQVPKPTITTLPPPVVTKVPVATPTPPPGCYYEQMNCIQGGPVGSTSTNCPAKLVCPPTKAPLPTAKPTATVTPTITPTPVVLCSYASPPPGCAYVKGTKFNPTTQCGMELKCTGALTPTSKPPVSADDYARLQKQLEELNKQVARQKAELEKANSLINKLQTYLKSFFNLK